MKIVACFQGSDELYDGEMEALVVVDDGGHCVAGAIVMCVSVLPSSGWSDVTLNILLEWMRLGLYSYICLGGGGEEH